jgi:hypothetical protein
VNSRGGRREEERGGEERGRKERGRKKRRREEEREVREVGEPTGSNLLLFKFNSNFLQK